MGSDDDSLENQHSPSKGTRSRTRGTAVVLESPRKTRKADQELSDLEVWDWPEEKIIGEWCFTLLKLDALLNLKSDAARKNWKAKTYDHYIMSLIREKDSVGSPHKLVFKFTPLAGDRRCMNGLRDP